MACHSRIDVPISNFQQVFFWCLNIFCFNFSFLILEALAVKASQRQGNAVVMLHMVDSGSIPSLIDANFFSILMLKEILACMGR
jgi:hypothetical protein